MQSRPAARASDPALLLHYTYMQAVLMGWAANLMIYVLEQRARRDFLREWAQRAGTDVRRARVDVCSSRQQDGGTAGQRSAGLGERAAGAARDTAEPCSAGCSAAGCGACSASCSGSTCAEAEQGTTGDATRAEAGGGVDVSSGGQEMVLVPEEELLPLLLEEVTQSIMAWRAAPQWALVLLLVAVTSWQLACLYYGV